MAIEFRCTQCNKLLRTGDDTAGQRAQCPGCGAITEIPGAAAPGGTPTPSLAPLGSSSPFTPGQSPGGQPPSGNPYQSPMAPVYSQAVQAEQRLAGPAIALMIVAILGIVGFLGIAGLYGVAGIVAVNQPRHMHNDRAEMITVFGIIVAASLVAVVLSVLIVIGARKMKNRESYAWAMTAAIIATIPCISPCGLLGMPFGIWAIIVLCDQTVKSAFRH
jgi:phage FluMu protein Com